MATRIGYTLISDQLSLQIPDQLYHITTVRNGVILVTQSCFSLLDCRVHRSPNPVNTRFLYLPIGREAADERFELVPMPASVDCFCSPDLIKTLVKVRIRGTRRNAVNSTFQTSGCRHLCDYHIISISWVDQNSDVLFAS